MKSNQLSKFLINALFYFAGFATLFAIATVLFMTVFPRLSNKPGMPEGMDIGTAMFSVLLVVLSFKIAYHVRNAALKMIDDDMFNSIVSYSLKWAGITMIAWACFKFVSRIYYHIINNSEVLESFKGIDSIINYTLFGLFFLLLSKVIEKGIVLENENDLTI